MKERPENGVGGQEERKKERGMGDGTSMGKGTEGGGGEGRGGGEEEKNE